jgi:mono/diheme cytochrome c family protein
MGPIKVNGKLVEGVPPVMPPHGFMKDEQLASILTYVRNAWGNQGKIISTEDIAEYRKDEAKRVSLWTESEF